MSGNQNTIDGVKTIKDLIENKKPQYIICVNGYSCYKIPYVFDYLNYKCVDSQITNDILNCNTFEFEMLQGKKYLFIEYWL